MSTLKEKGIKAICLDIDGTLYPRSQMNLRLIPSFFPNIRLGLKFNKVRQMYRSTQEIDFPKSDNLEGFLEKQAKLYLNKKNPTKKEIEKVIRKIDKQFYKSWEKTFLSIRGYKNMLKTLERAKKENIKIVLLSDFPIAQKPKTLKVENIIDFAISSEQTGYLKPSEKPFIYICNNLNLDPKSCIYIGDSYNKDIIGAKKINMKTLYLTKKSNKKKYPEADFICKNWFEIEKKLFE
ncbi:MAG: HAD family hydrolase [Sphaerochaetaceae bacterium]|nr:HAD family hydrolase [Sphaerochaetaceae bacterium]MDC7236882.1 HAD family hydrolase [Sphaerochaetaceae bacterium]